jgi:hypothetical protein
MQSDSKGKQETPIFDDERRPSAKQNPGLEFLMKQAKK